MKTTRKINGYSIELFGRCTWETRYRRWGQLNYSYHSTDKWGSFTVSSFRSIVWLDGDWHAYKMWPYLAYSGDRPLKYRRLSAMQTLGIYAIAVRTGAKHTIHWTIPGLIRSAKSAVRHAITRIIRRLNPIAAYRSRKARKAAGRFWLDLGL